jgi:hypothetical protein
MLFEFLEQIIDSISRMIFLSDNPLQFLLITSLSQGQAGFVPLRFFGNEDLLSSAKYNLAKLTLLAADYN